MNKEDSSTPMDVAPNESAQSLSKTNTPLSKEEFSPNSPFGTTNQRSNYSPVLVTEEDVSKKESQKYFSCKDDLKSEGLWRNLSLQHWPELLDLYGVNVIDRYARLSVDTLKTTVYSRISRFLWTTERKG